MIIGITGTDGAGKGTVVEYLVGEKGFTHYAARTLFLEEIARQGIEPTRANMRLVANELRSVHGNDHAVAAYLERAMQEGVSDAVIESIRTMAEVETLKAAGGILLAADADQKLRYERITSRASESDAVTFAEFVAHEALEMNDPDPHGMQKAAVMAAADYTVTNDGTLSELHAQIEEMLAKIAARA